MRKNAIISVFDKTNLDNIARFLRKKKFTIYSTGGTSKYLKEKIFLILKFQNIQNKKKSLGESKNTTP